MPRVASTTRNKRTAPVILPNVTESGDFTVGQDTPRLQSSTDRETPLEPALIVPVDRPVEEVNNEKIEMLMFFNDDVRVRIATTNDKNADQVFEINVNGRLEFFRRGESKTVKRYIVDRLARLKETSYRQEEIVKDGVKHIVNLPTTSLKYDFSVEHDPHPRGRSWLQSVLSEA
jgi:hypothetical protein